MKPIQARACSFLFKSLRSIGIALLMAGLAHAVTITVPCSGSGGGVSGLIAAINTANSTSGANTINLTPGCVYTLTTTVAGQFLNGLPPITGNLTINGYGATIERSHAKGTPNFRIFAVSGGSLTLNTATAKGGQVQNNDVGFPCEDGPDGFDGGFGGGVCVDGGATLTLNRSAVTENISLQSVGGAVFEYSRGGGIWNFGSATLNHSVVCRNVAVNEAEDGNGAQGGGIYNLGDLRLERSTITHNTVIAADGSTAEGGGIFNGSGRMTAHQSVFSYNVARLEGLGLGSNAVGGGISIEGGTATLDESIIRDNAAVSVGAAPPAQFNLAEAGGIYIAGTATLDHSLVLSNTAVVHGSVTGTAGGGGIGVSGNAKLVHTVVAHNTARAPRTQGDIARGGGIDNSATGTATLDHSEVVENTAEGDGIANSLGGGIYNANTTSGSVALSETKVKDNHPDQCDPTGSVPGCSN